jgi:Tol biopolymer transport system component
LSRPAPAATATLAVAILALAGCTGPTSSPSGDTARPAASAEASASASEAVHSAAASAAAVLAAPFGRDVISTDDEEYRISFSPDGTTALFARGDGFFPQTREATIYETRLVDGEWTEPTVAPFSGAYPDIDPWFSPDGASVFFSSIRPVDEEPRRDAELFRVDRQGSGWSDPVHLASLGSDGDELGASVAADGAIVFASDRGSQGADWDLYVATAAEDGAFADPEALADLNTADWEFNPAIDPDGTTLVFTSIGRAGGSGLGDLFLAERGGEGWTEIGPVRTNSASDEYHASWSLDGDLLFVRRLGDGDLYIVPWADARP